jgi:predicted ATPase/class 3 adenylate cyclase
VDVSRWLAKQGLGHHAEVFAKNGVAGDILRDLTDSDLKELGLNLGDRKRLLKAIAALDSGPTQDRIMPAEAIATAAVPREAERRQLTVMFVDLVGSTALSARLDPEDTGKVIRAYQECCAEVVQRWGGHVAKYMGDGVVAYYGWPQAHEDDAERAVRAGLAIAKRVADLEAPDGARLAARIGIATGLVVIGELVGDAEAREHAVVGETPNLAARLQALAEPGAVVISQATRRLVGSLFELTDLGPHRLKGFAEPLAAFRVEGEGRAESRFEALHGEHLTPLVGREHELGILLERWAWAQDGDGQVVLLSGEPGIGKSRVIRALRERLDDEPYTPLSHYCSPYHTNSALYPVIDRLERAARLDRDEPPKTQLAKLAAVFGRLSDLPDETMPLLAALLGVPTGECYPALTLTPEVQKRRTLQALLDQLAALAAQQPVLMIYEDVHWVDPSTLELLGLMIERIPQLRVLALITFRPEFQPPWTGHAHVTTVAMSRLGRRQGTHLVAQITGDKPLPATIVEQIVARTDGVPLFVEELTKTVLESGLVANAGDSYELSGSMPPVAIPTSLHDSLMARLDRLAPAKEVAQIGSVIGREFPHKLLAAVVDCPEPQLQAALDQLVSAELIFRRGAVPDATYSFKHALVQDAAYQSLLKSKRQHLHARIAHALEKSFPESGAMQPELLAHHFSQANLAERAILYWHRAGQRAIEQSAMAEAVSQLSRGLELLLRLPESAGRDRQELEQQVTLGVALLAARGQPAAKTGRAYARARELSERLGETRHLLRVLSGLASHHGARGELPAAREAAETMLRLAREEHDVVAQIAAHRSAGSPALIAGQFGEARAQLERVLALYDPTEHHQLAFLYGQDPRASALAWLSWPLLATGYPDQALARLRDGLAHAREMAHPNTLAQALFCACVVRQLLRDRSGVVEFAEALSLLSAEQGFPYWLAMATIFQGCELDEADRSVTKIQSGLTAYRKTEAQVWLPYFLTLLTEAETRSGRAVQTCSLLEHALDRVENTGERWFEAELHRRKGEILLRLHLSDPSEAEASFCKALAVAQQQDAKLWELRAATGLARLWAYQGKRAQAHDLLAPIYGWFKEGFDTADLKDAKALLDELA